MLSNNLKIYLLFGELHVSLSIYFHSVSQFEACCLKTGSKCLVLGMLLFVQTDETLQVGTKFREKNLRFLCFSHCQYRDGSILSLEECVWHCIQSVVQMESVVLLV